MNNAAPTEVPLNADTDGINLLALACERISHSLRSPLGVVKGLLHDVEHGYSLTKDDYHFGKEALQQILAWLNVLSQMQLRGLNSDCRSLLEFLQESSTYGCDTSMPNPRLDLLAAKRVDAQLLGKAFYLASAYANCRNTAQPYRPVLLADPCEGRGNANSIVQLRLIFPIELINRSLYPGRALKPVVLLGLDRSLEALGMLVVERIAELHGGSCWLELLPGHTAVVLEF